MKVLLVNATWPYKNSEYYNINVYTPEVSTVWPPIGLAYIATALLDAGHSVEIFDRNAVLFKTGSYEETNIKMIQVMKRISPDVVGISSTTPTIKDAFKCADIVKCVNSRIKLILGGVHGTALPKETLLENANIDIVAMGEGEESIVEICDCVDLHRIRGIAFRDLNGQIVVNERRNVIKNIDDISYPARNLLDMDFYLRPSTQVIFGYRCRATSIVSSRGCPNKCAFCAGSIMSQNKVRFHSVGYTINEIESLVKEYGVEGLFFTDEMFTADKRRVLMLCEALVQSGINSKVVWGAQLRVDYVDEEILKAMKMAGCVQVEYGIESGSQRILNEMNKNITVNDCIIASELTKKVGIRQLVNVIVGWPSETFEDLQCTVNLVREMNADFVSWHEFKPLPGSRGWEYAKKFQIEGNSFEENRPFLFCDVSEEEKSRMELLYESSKKMCRDKMNTKDGLYVLNS